MCSGAECAQRWSSVLLPLLERSADAFDAGLCPTVSQGTILQREPRDNGDLQPEQSTTELRAAGVTCTDAQRPRQNADAPRGYLAPQRKLDGRKAAAKKARL